MSGITRDDWLRAMEDAGMKQAVDDREALTGTEFAEMFDLERTAAQRRLKALVDAGKATVTTKRVVDGKGRRYYQAAYRLVEEKPRVKDRARHR